MKNTAVVILLGLVGIAGCGPPENDTSNPTANFVQVSDGIYRGARPDDSGMQALAAMQIKTILDLEDESDAIAHETEKAKEVGIQEVFVSMNAADNPAPDDIRMALNTLADPMNRPIFVHCKKGMDRTGAVIALHRVFNEGWSANEAVDEMLNRGFDTSLLRLKDYVALKTGLEE